MQACLKRLHLQWRTRSESQAVAERASSEPGRSFDIDPRQRTFDDLDLNRPIDNVLIGNDGAGGDVALVHIQECECQSQAFQILSGEDLVLVGLRDGFKFRIGKYRVSCHLNGFD